jgi:tetratricopeptide (TPR) repeat protein
MNTHARDENSRNESLSMGVAESPAQRGFRWELVYVSLLCLFALVAIASFLPEKRFWGINHLAFYSTSVKLTALAVIAVSFVPMVSQFIYSKLCGALAALRARRKDRTWLLVVVPLAAVVVFLVFQSTTLLLGDGQLIANEFEHTLGSRPTSIRLDFRTLVLEHSDAKGATLLYYGAAAMASRVFDISPVSGIRTLNCVLGGVLTLILLLIALRGPLSTELGMWLAFLMLSSGTMQLFFGYVENYTPVLFFAYLYLLSGLMFIHKKRRLWLGLVILFFGLSVAMHRLGALLTPSIGLLLGWSLLRVRGRKSLRCLTAALVAVFLIVTCVVAEFTEYGRHFLPLRAAEDIYGVFTPAHWLDILNELLIVLPALPLFIVMAVLGYRHSRLTRSSTADSAAESGRWDAGIEPAGGAWLRTEIECYWFLLIAIPCLVFVIVFRTEIGMARDWDLLSITIVGLLPLALHTLNRSLVRWGGAWMPSITAPALVLSVVLGMAWIGINASPERAARRYESILEYDRTFARYAYEILARHYYDDARLGEAIAAMEKAVSGSDNVRIQALLVVYYVDAGRTDEAIELLKEILRALPLYDKGRTQLVILLDLAKRYEEVLPVARAGTRYHPQEPMYHYFYGKALIETGDIEEGGRELLEAERLNPPPAIMNDIKRVLKRLKMDGKFQVPDDRIKREQER